MCDHGEFTPSCDYCMSVYDLLGYAEREGYNPPDLEDWKDCKNYYEKSQEISPDYFQDEFGEEELNNYPKHEWN